MSTTQAPAIDMKKLNALIGQFVTDLGTAAHTGMVVIGKSLAVTHELGHAICDEHDEAAADRFGEELKVKNPLRETYEERWQQLPLVQKAGVTVAVGFWLLFIAAMIWGDGRCRHPFSAHNTLHCRQESAPLKTSGYCWVSRSFDL